MYANCVLIPFVSVVMRHYVSVASFGCVEGVVCLFNIVQTLVYTTYNSERTESTSWQLLI
jgi:hypothetical protein